jgi:AraC-like DNA-binding protein
MPLEPLADRIPKVDILKWGMEGAAILLATHDGLRHIVRPNYPGFGDDAIIGVHLSGASILRLRRQEVMLDSGDGILFSSMEEGFVAYRPTPVSFLALQLPRKMLTPIAANLDDAAVRVIAGRSNALRLLTTYIRSLDPTEISDAQELGRAVSTHIHDLVALTIGGHPDAMAFAQGRGARAARLQAIKADVSRNAGDIDLTVVAVATRHGVTPRYIHKLFETEDVTFSEFVLTRRLAIAHRFLSDQRLAHRSIASIAFDAGFADLSYFNRTFRRQYSVTPSEVRAASR